MLKKQFLLLKKVVEIFWAYLTGKFPFLYLFFESKSNVNKFVRFRNTNENKIFLKIWSLLGLFCAIQIFSGLILRMHYKKKIIYAFLSVKLKIQNEVFLGWFFHKVHSSGASFFFILLYIHLFRGIYYGGIKQIKIWLRGVSILILRMAIAFLGYVLPWGQMSFWGATVITKLFSAIPYLGNDILKILWGGYGVAAPTLNRFFLCILLFLL